MSIIKRLSLYEFASRGQDFVSLVLIREGPYYRGFSVLEEMYENFSVHRKLSVIESCPYRGGSTVFVKHAYVVFTGFYKNHSRMSHEIVPVKCISFC